MAQAFTTSDVEILLSTMNRTSLDFLLPMFPFSHFSNFRILIVNQTQHDKLLRSDYPSVRVINSFERGLSRSRNMLLDNASARIGLIADDDLIFVEGFTERIVKGFNHFPQAAIVKYITTTFEGVPFRKYPKEPVANLNAMLRLNSSSIEMALNIKVVKSSGVKFDTNFGLGTSFPLGEEPVFINDLHEAGYQVSHYPEVITTHKDTKDSDQIPMDLNYKTRGAYLYRIFRKQFNLWLAIQIFFNVKNGVIALSQIPYCLRHGLEGKRQIKNFMKSKA